MSNSVIGRRRSDRVLNPSYVQGLGDLSNDELLERRDEALQEESDVSYIRRLIQGRLDLLRFEVNRRRDSSDVDVTDQANDDAALVRALTSVLTDKHQGAPRATQAAGARALPVHTTCDPQVAVFSRRSAESAVADVRFSDLRSLGDAELAEAIDRFTGLEAEVSLQRTRVQRVADVLAEEVEHRVSQGSMSPNVM